MTVISMSTEKPNNRHIAYIDTLRIIAILLVCLIHSPILYLGTAYEHPFMAAYETVVGGANIFLMISGSLLLPVKKPWREFVSRRLHVVGWPLLFWTVVYMAVGFATGSKTWSDVLMLPLMPADHTLWFVYQIIMVYLTLPVASICIKAAGKRGVQIYLLLWALSSLIPYQHGVINAMAAQQHPLSFFHNCYGYVILGYYLRHNPLPLFTLRHGWWITLIMLFGIVGVPLFEFNMQPDLTWRDHIVAITDHVSINSVMMSTLVFTTVQHFCPEHYSEPETGGARFWRTLGKCTFGIYLMHILMLEQLCVPLFNMIYQTLHPSFIVWILCITVGMAAVAFIISAVVTRLILLLPFSRLIVGR